MAENLPELKKDMNWKVSSGIHKNSPTYSYITVNLNNKEEILKTTIEKKLPTKETQ